MGTILQEEEKNKKERTDRRRLAKKWMGMQKEKQKMFDKRTMKMKSL